LQARVGTPKEIGMQAIHSFVDWFNGIVWGVPMIVLILGTGLYLNIRLRFMPILKIGHGFKMIWTGRKKQAMPMAKSRLSQP
jgi:AGCS family alanine or glycine:cation symporter